MFSDSGLKSQQWDWIVLFAVFLFKHVRLLVNCIVYYYLYRPVRPSFEQQCFTSEDVTVIIPTIVEDTDELLETLGSALRLQPKEIILVTVNSCLKKIYAMVDAMPAGKKRVTVTSVTHANKRIQLCHALPHVRTAFTLLLDDDVLLPTRFMDWTLAPFKNPKVGGVGTNQRLRRKESPNSFDFLGALYLERRNFDCLACNWMDGGLPCLSGRAVMYRTEILQDPDFTYGFANETWSSYQLNADDDNFITRWLFSHKWKIQFQYHAECEVQTTLEGNWKYLKQCLRWVRSNWRSNLRSMFVERNVWTSHPWSTYAVFQTTLTAWALPYDLSLFFLLWRAMCTRDWTANAELWYAVWAAFLSLWSATKYVKFLGYYARYPTDLRFLPISILFGYFHNFIKLKGLFTLGATTWGSREGADTDDAYRMIRLPPYSVTDNPHTG